MRNLEHEEVLLKVWEEQFSIASDPQTSPEKLHEIARGSTISKIICQAVARNPNAGIDTLKYLAPLYLSEILINPAFPLLSLEATYIDDILLSRGDNFQPPAIYYLREIPDWLEGWVMNSPNQKILAYWLSAGSDEVFCSDEFKLWTLRNHYDIPF